MTALLGVMFCSVSAQASTVLFSTLGPNDVYEWDQGFRTVGDFVIGGNQAWAMRFNLGANATVDDATLALINIWGGGNPANVYIESDTPDNGEHPENGGVPGSSILITLTQAEDSPYDGGLVNFTCDASCNLGAGWYWLVAAESDPLYSPQGWFLAQTRDAVGIVALSRDGGAWVVTGNSALTAFQIDGTTSSIPEPSSLLLFGSGLVGFAALLRRRKSR